MGEQSEKIKKNICMGLLAHVDAGKTTLSEALFIFKRQDTKAWKSGSQGCISGYLSP